MTKKTAYRLDGAARLVEEPPRNNRNRRYHKTAAGIKVQDLLGGRRLLGPAQSRNHDLALDDDEDYIRREDQLFGSFDCAKV